MQSDQSWNHNSEDYCKDPDNPDKNHLAYIWTPCIFAPKKSHCDDVQQEMNHCREDHRNKLAVVEIADAVVDPDAVMVEPFDTAV